MRIDVLTLFPGMLASPLEHSILKRARDAGLLDVRPVDLRAFTTDRHRQVDDCPYGGGPGMVMKPEPLFAAVESLSALPPPPDRVILLTPLGRRFDQAAARELAAARRLIMICGRYEGIDERVHRHLATDELSLGDYVLTGGELAALVVIDAVARLLPGVLGKDESSIGETFTEPLLEYPQYTRPPEFRGWKVPEILFSGDHGAVERWRREQSLRRTLERRPDLFLRHELTPQDLKLLGLVPPKPKRKRRAAPPAPQSWGEPTDSMGGSVSPGEDGSPSGGARTSCPHEAVEREEEGARGSDQPGEAGSPPDSVLSPQGWGAGGGTR